MTILRAVPHFTPLTRCAAPTPIMADEMTCVVETGKWINVAPKIIDAEAKSAATPFTGRNPAQHQYHFYNRTATDTEKNKKDKSDGTWREERD